MYPFTYKVQVIDELDERRLFNDGGIVYAACYAEAANMIAEHYGEKNVVEIKNLCPLEDGPVILTEEIIDNLQNDAYIGLEEKYVKC